MSTITIDDIELRIDGTEMIGICLHDVTVEAGRDMDGAVVLSDLRVNGRPYPGRGGVPGAFDREFASRLIEAVYRSSGWMARMECELSPHQLNDGIPPGKLLETEVR